MRSSRTVRLVLAITAGVAVTTGAWAQNLDVKGTTTAEGNAFFYQNVGIGTTAPTEMLQLRGGGLLIDNLGGLTFNHELAAAVRVQAGYVGGWARGFGFANSTNNTLALFGAYGTNDALNYAYVGPSYSSPWMMFLPSGNVGIGTTAAGSGTKLQVVGRGLFTAGSFDPGDGTPAGVGISYDGSAGHIEVVQTGVTAKPLEINHYGNVGVGMASPTEKLTIAGNVRINNDSPYPALVMSANVTGGGSTKGATVHQIFGPYNASGGDVGAWYFGAGQSANGSRNDIVFYNYSCNGGTCNVPQIVLDADTTLLSGNLQLAGGAYSDGYGWYTASSRERKEEIRPLEHPLAILERVNVYRYRYRDSPDRRERIGVIAEELPDEVAAADRKAAPAGELIALALAANRELLRQLKEQEARIERLERALAESR